MKRLIDFLLALIGLIIFSPLFLICYIAIRIEDGKPVIFKQQRIGRYGKPFYIYKFRSLTIDGGNEEEEYFQVVTLNGDDMVLRNQDLQLWFRKF